nr:hypothetical protein [uncultured Carboxylicivirga sp.]
MFNRKKKIEVNAILDTQVEDLLKKTAQYEDLVEGRLKCNSCGSIITTQNIGIMQPIENGSKIKFYCDRVDCSEQYKLDHE